MKKIGRIVSTLLAVLIGGISVIAGSRVLLNIDTPNYHVLDWLVIYNVLLGLASLFVAFKIWKGAGSKWPSAIMLSHLTILIVLVTLFKETVAIDSIKAMSFRSAIWSVILLITYLRTKK